MIDPVQTKWQFTMDVVMGNYNVECYRTTHHSSTRNGKPWGMEFEVAYNKDKDIFVKITPGSGSLRDIIQKEKADELLKDGKTLIWERKKDHGTYHHKDNGKVEFYIWINVGRNV